MATARSAARRAVVTVSLLALVSTALTGISAMSPSRSSAATTLPALRLQPVADVEQLTAMATRKDDRALYVTQQQGVVRAVLHGDVIDPPVLDISEDVTNNGEQGLLGLAFSPDGTKLYIDYTNRTGDTRVEEFAMNGRVAELGTRRTVLAIVQPQVNHNGGQLVFGPDGYLYIGMGDGGASFDVGRGHVPGGNAQSLGSLLGKILRIDPTPSGDDPYTIPPDNPFVGREGARPEIWAYGLRNPWRFSFDSVTGDLWIGDVGQDKVEEIDFAAATKGRDAGKGDNFGWNRFEGNDELDGTPPTDVVAPVLTQSHDDGWLAIIGGPVYRGAIKPLRGVYFYADYYKGQIVGARESGGTVTPVDVGVSGSAIAAFGVGPDGSLYVLSQTDGILKIVRANT